MQKTWKLSNDLKYSKKIVHERKLLAKLHVTDYNVTPGNYFDSLSKKILTLVMLKFRISNGSHKDVLVYISGRILALRVVALLPSFARSMEQRDTF